MQEDRGWEPLQNTERTEERRQVYREIQHKVMVEVIKGRELETAAPLPNRMPKGFL